MKTLKKTLCLVLAVVMVVGVLVIPANADYDDFKDTADIEHAEAVEVLTALSVIDGTSDTAFTPKGELTRAQGATLVARALLGRTLADGLPVAETFSDVTAAFNWASGAISYGVQNHIIAGVGGNRFNPKGTLTGYQLAKMMLVAMGYGEGSKYEGVGYEMKVFLDAQDAGLIDDIDDFNGTKAVTRDQAAQMLLNGLTYGEQVTETTTKYVVLGVGADAADKVADGVIGNLYTSYAAAKAAAEGTGSNSPVMGTDYTINTVTVTEATTKDSLAERVFGMTVVHTDTSDAMGCPGTTYSCSSWSDDLIFADEPGKEVVIADTSTQTEKALADSAKKGATAFVSTIVNGGTDATTNLKVGDVVALYVTSTGVKACVTRYSVGTLTGDPATQGTGSSLKVRVPGIIGAWTAANLVDGYEDLAKGDVVYYYTDADSVYHLGKAASFNGTLSKVSNDKYNINNTDYQANGNVTLPTLITAGTDRFKTEYTYYTDANGFLISASEKVDGQTQSKDYVILKDLVWVSGTGSLNDSQYAEGRLVKMDGTTEIVKINSVTITAAVATNTKTYKGVETSSDSGEYLYYNPTSSGSAKFNTNVKTESGGVVNNTFFTYVEKDGAYDLTSVITSDVPGTGSQGVVIDTGAANITVNGAKKVAVDGKTVFVVAEKDSTDQYTGKFTVYTGNNSVPKIELATQNTDKIYYLATNGIATYVYVPAFNKASNETEGESVFILDANRTGSVTNSSGTFDTYKAVVNGSEYKDVAIKVNGSHQANIGGSDAAVKKAIYTPTYDADGNITKLTGEVDKTSAGKNGYVLSGGTLVVTGDENKGYKCGDVPAFIVDETRRTVTATTTAELNKDANDTIYVMADSEDNVLYVVIEENSDSDATLSLEKVYSDSDNASTELSGFTKFDLDRSNVNAVTLKNGHTKAKLEVKAAGVGATVMWKDNASQTTYKAVVSSKTDAINVSSGAAVTVTFQVTTVDGSVTEYTVTLTVPED